MDQFQKKGNEILILKRTKNNHLLFESSREQQEQEGMTETLCADDE